MFTIVVFLLILSVLVLVHEFGHFITARIFGMRVYEFGMGFPPRLGGVYRDPVTKKWVWVWGRGRNTLSETVGGDERQEEFPATLYSVNWLPIGGFCKIKGESGDQSVQTDSFAHHKPWKRLIVLVAGVVMNVVLAAVLFAVGFGIGLPAMVDGSLDARAEIVVPASVVVQQIVPESPAKTAGVSLGDHIISIAGQPVVKASDVTTIVESHGVTRYDMVIKRDGVEKTLSITPDTANKNGIFVPRIGVAMAEIVVIRYPWYIAIGKGVAAALTGVVTILATLGYMIVEIFRGHGLVADVSGPVGIASVVGQSARLGIGYLINVTAMISLSLAAMNILPIPALDGGRALFVAIEKVFRRKVAIRYEQIAHTIGFVLLMILIVVVTTRDIIGLIH
jgi:regulator of sigma E protease